MFQVTTLDLNKVAETGKVDYDKDFWDMGNYRLNADKIKCTALIVHGLNDENVSTKQFDSCKATCFRFTHIRMDTRKIPVCYSKYKT